MTVSRPFSHKKADELDEKLQRSFWANGASIYYADKERKKLTHEEDVDNAVAEGWDSLGWDDYEEDNV